MISKIRIGVVIGLVIVIIAGGATLFFRLNSDSYPIEISLPPVSDDIEVYISGEVQIPGVYILPEGSRIVDLVELAGGFTGVADSIAVNPAGILRDGARIHILAEGESSQKININTADAWLLDALPGIGETLAERIVEHRLQNGPFGSIDDLKQVKGVREATIEKIRDKIAVR